MPRKNVRGKTGVRFKAGYTTSKNKSMLRNVVTELFIHGKVEVTEKTATELQPLAEKMITLAKKGDLAARRQAAKVVRDVYADKEETQTALQKLFSEIAGKYQDRQGGYTRVIKLDNRRGDNSPMALVELV
ncbi:MAG: 50S ribosomal protein L17 [Erysipelotrichaceae bacterium]|nr:50S ribosomal protein L17 [Erysipelotrichaceae bacterium]